jgi:hypothetical protein
MARKSSARTPQRKAAEQDAELLAKLDRMVARDPKLEPGDALEMLGADLVTQRRVRKQFEQAQTEARASAKKANGGSGHREARALSSTKEARVTGPSHSQLRPVDEARPSAEMADERRSSDDASADEGQGRPGGSPMPSPALLAELGRRLAQLSVEAAEAEVGLAAKAVGADKGEGQPPRGEKAEPAPKGPARNGSGAWAGAPQMPMPWVKLGLDSTVSALRFQHVMLDAWFKNPVVRLALTQQTMLFNSMLQLAAANPLVKR